MTKEDIRKVIQGLVKYKDEWVTIEKKVGFTKDWRKRIEDGYVFFLNEWVPIAQKYKHLTKGDATIPSEKPHVVINSQVTNT